MATAIVAGMLERGGFAKCDILAADISEKARDSFGKSVGIPCSDNPAAIAAESDVVFLAVKPQVGEVVAAEIADALRGKLVVSILAGIPIQTLSRWTGHGRVARIMPNTPLMVGLGASAVAFGPDTTEQDKDFVKSIFAANGIVRELPENLMDAVTALSGSGPAYFFEMIDALAEAGTAAGIPADTALELAAKTAAGAAAMVEAKRFGSPSELRDAVTSPGGTTAAGLAVMKERGFRDMVSKVFEAAERRSKELGAGK